MSRGRSLRSHLYRAARDSGHVEAAAKGPTRLAGGSIGAVCPAP